MSLIPHLYGRRSNVFDPFSVEMCNPFQGWPSNNNFRSLSDHIRSEAASFAHANVDWKETLTAHIFKADVPGLKKEEVKVEMEEGRVLQISGKRNHEQEEKGDTWHRVSKAVESSSAGSGCRRMQMWIRSRRRWRTACLQ
ncbi:18.5 kDa class I heat shock protein [Camellia lanceoleosa]|uniref:18.5 kDa class I heat shock protein n=1 Tax=Camellia lanceoleosa TaxID=1840588 RepID=A0ACC0J5F2_9ERIC|nr:18.5 kDa class I heat shock protein [Camellia lanceoleosa]